MKVSDYIVQFLCKKGIKYVFGHIGGFNADILDSLYLNKNIKYVLNYHEQASAFAANAYSAIKNDTGVAMSSGAPSSCNLIPGIANAYFDSNPCIFICGSSNSLGSKESDNIRQNLFEEIDMLPIVSSITKYAVKINNPLDIRYELEKAFYTANEGRKGPVLIDIPYNIAREDIDTANLKSFEQQNIDKYDDFNIEQIKTILQNSKMPLILAGGGMKSNYARKKLKELLKKIKIPVVASLCGLDVLPHNHECYLGFIGHYGNRYANLAVAHCDCLIVLGSRLDERQLGGYKTKLSENTKIIRVDIDKFELGRKIPETLSIFSPVENFLSNLLKEDLESYDYSNWRNLLNSWKNKYPSYDLSSDKINANNFLRYISDLLPSDAIICADVGQNQMSTAQVVKLDNNRRLLNSAGYASMGFSLPAAIGAAYVTDKKTMILSINGDGGLQMNIQELQTIKRDNLPVNIILLNNHCLGMIRKTQERLFNGRCFASVQGYSAPNFQAISKAYEIPYLCIKSVDDYIKVQDFLSSSSPRFVEVTLPVNIENYPEPGDYIDRQNPLLNEAEIEKIKDEIKNVIK